MRLQILNKKKKERKEYSNKFSTKEISSWTFLCINLVHALIERTNEGRNELVGISQSISSNDSIIFCEKNRFHCACHYARCKLFQRGWVGGCLSRKHARNLSDGGISLSLSLSEISFADLSPGTRSHSSLPRFSILSSLPSSTFGHWLSIIG